MMFTNLDRFVRRLANLTSTLGILVVLFNLALLLVDIIGSKVFNHPVPGSIELAGLTQAIIICSATALTQLSKQHIRVDLVTMHLPKRVQAGLNVFISLLLFVLFAWIIWQLVANGIEIQDKGQYTSDLHMPLQVFIYLTALMLVPACLVFLIEFWEALRGVLNKKIQATAGGQQQ
jgi:TRAP-type C4-dicarboxylate transport system permease small subunit